MDAEVAAEQHEQQKDDTEVFQELDSYPWDDDSEFQGGLSAILGSSSSPSQTEVLTLRARCFYYARKKKLLTPIDFEGYKAWHATHSASSLTAPTASNISSKHQTSSTDSQPPDSDPDTPPYPVSFAALVELITSGAPIPGIKDIPPTLLTSRATQPAAAKRRKPWEKDGHVIEKVEDAKEGTFGDQRDRIIVQDLPDDEDEGTKESKSEES